MNTAHEKEVIKFLETFAATYDGVNEDELVYLYDILQAHLEQANKLLEEIEHDP